MEKLLWMFGVFRTLDKKVIAPCDGSNIETDFPKARAKMNSLSDGSSWSSWSTRGCDLLLPVREVCSLSLWVDVPNRPVHARTPPQASTNTWNTKTLRGYLALDEQAHTKTCHAQNSTTNCPSTHRTLTLNIQSAGTSKFITKHKRLSTEHKSRCQQTGRNTVQGGRSVHFLASMTTAWRMFPRLQNSYFILFFLFVCFFFLGREGGFFWAEFYILKFTGKLVKSQVD